MNNELEGNWETEEVKAIRQLRSTLQPHQLRAFDYLHWYFYGARATGRTYLAVTVAICHALENPNTWIPIFDVFSAYPIYYDYLKGLIWNRIKELQDQYKFEVQTRNHFLHIKYMKQVIK